jgi:dinuclear metal center YbgI/SA1388 family protein
MITVRELECFLNDFLKTSGFRDSSWNGLQVEASCEVGIVALGVSASLHLFEKSREARAQAIVVHHGLFWEKGDMRLRGLRGRRVGYLYQNDLSLLAYHLPLDAHPGIGNNASLIKTLPIGVIEPFGQFREMNLGYRGVLKEVLELGQIRSLFESYLEVSSLQCYDFGPREIRKVGVVSGGASDIILQAAELGLDLFITGEVAEDTQEICRECHINYLALGHYVSEKPGIINLGKELERQLACKTVFIDLFNRY